jgi:pimeloyl-ACP methyl ester carboxylesterase
VRERYLHKERWIGALEATRSPVQLVWGAEDPIANVAMGRALADLLPRARYTEVPGVGHFVPIEAPEVVADALVELVAPS